MVRLAISQMKPDVRLLLLASITGGYQAVSRLINMTMAGTAVRRVEPWVGGAMVPSLR
jgi:hypothetical protein